MNRITWFADEIIAQTNPRNWDGITLASRRLMNLIGNPEFTHDVILPQNCLPSLARELHTTTFSVAIDLTGGWLSESLKGVLGSIPVIKDFHMSRVREVSNPELPTTGHVLNITKDKAIHFLQNIDTSAPLILDDVSFSGFSSHVTVEHFQLNPKKTTHAFLVLNIGDLGDQPGAKRNLESTGGRVIAGQTLNTSENEDGWHLKDLINHQSLERTLGLVLPLQEFIEKGNGVAIRDLFATESLRKLLFPNATTIEHLNILEEKGNFIPNKKHKPDEHSIHTTNPLLLISPYFLKHVSSHIFREHFDEVANTLIWLSDVLKQDEITFETTRELRRSISDNQILGGHGRERLC